MPSPASRLLLCVATVVVWTNFKDAGGAGGTLVFTQRGALPSLS